jgi:outer membrane protein OmpA-like peptidoglycan-associated protein
MKKIHFTPILLAIAVLVSACSSLPKTTSLLDQTRSDFAVAQNNPSIENYAKLEMSQATEALAAANAAASKDESAQEIDKLAYIAKQKIALTQEVAKQKSAETEIANAAKLRDQMRLDQRTNEADRAKLSAEQAKAVADQARLAAQVAQEQAANSQLKTQQAQDEANRAQLQTQEAQARAMQLEAQLADLAAKKTERGMVITLSDVLFGTNVSDLTPSGMATIKKLADVMQQNPNRSVLVEGFTDSIGTEAYNLSLSERRANSVRNALTSMGISRERVDIRGYGESFPVASNATAQDRQLNRRVEIILSDENGKVSLRK